MKKISIKTGITLIELIVSMALLSIVALGIFSISQVLSANNQDYGQRYLVRSETQTTLNHVLNNASLAFGSAIANDEAILIGGTHGLVDRNTFCIRQPQGIGNNLINYNAGDIWLCYSWTNTVANPYQINWCAETYTGPGPDPRNASSCSSSSSLIPNPATGATTTYLGTARNGFQAKPPTFTSNGTQLLFTVTLTNCLDNSLGSCQPSGTSTDPVNNPEVQVSGSVIPTQSSM